MTSSLIQLLFALFKEDYQLWTVLGASRLQLSFLIGCQLSVIAFLASLVGSTLSVFFARSYYILVQGLAGKTMLPTIPISFSFIAFSLSIFIISVIAFLGGFYYAYKLLKRTAIFDETVSFKKRLFLRLFKFSCLVFLLSQWIILIKSYISPVSSMSKSDIIDVQSDIAFELLILHVIILQLVSPQLQIIITKILFKLNSSYGFIMAKWHILQERFYLKSLTTSIITGVTLISGFLLYSFNVLYADRTDKLNKIHETNALLLFLVAPILIILANVISITILSSNQEKGIIQQWKIQGISEKQKSIIRLCEAFIYTFLVIIISLGFNLIIFFLTINSAKLMGYIVTDYNDIYLPLLIVSVILFMFIFITKTLTDLRVR
ncbi:uncharacterized protein SRT_19460 [Streptococcus troglodytae]|uniref:ABC3 transporter permease C-terminal domain-containing protein n=1 Tax=Streptococcus troglodytae TaxID=1111760 RepID=A0A1L7LLY4_9STRE|nr:FtsX-like permease family protein [Streptococcus troglodytae]BAQ25207.1 uncharacterized protein SRT_19460 [Streptococcus troglodytae]